MGQKASGFGPKPRIAVVGSGPAGCYAAQFMRKSWAEAEITIFERLPVPYGLIRYGVAPDHQGTKAIQQQFERLFARDAVQFIGNVEIGRDIPIEKMRAAFDIVILATGLSGDRKLAVPGCSELGGVFGAGQITRILNEHPEESLEDVVIGKHVVIVGNGNVALDVARLLIKPDSAFEASDLTLATRRHMLRQSIDTVDILGRSPAHTAKFDAPMISELAHIPNVRFAINGLVNQAPPDDLRVRALMDLVSKSTYDNVESCDSTVVTFHFGWIPEAVFGAGRVQRLVARSTTSTESDLTLEADTIITAIGFEERPKHDLPLSSLIDNNADLAAGRLSSGLYGVGWCVQGSRGNIPFNRTRSRATAKTIVDDVNSGRLRLGKPGRNSLSSHCLARATDYQGWKQIDAVERDMASSTMVRRKIKHVSEMLEVASRASNSPGRQPTSASGVSS